MLPTLQSGKSLLTVQEVTKVPTLCYCLICKINNLRVIVMDAVGKRNNIVRETENLYKRKNKCINSLKWTFDSCFLSQIINPLPCPGFGLAKVTKKRQVCTLHMHSVSCSGCSWEPGGLVRLWVFWIGKGIKAAPDTCWGAPKMNSSFKLCRRWNKYLTSKMELYCIVYCITDF